MWTEREALIERTCGLGQPIHKYAEMVLQTPGLDSFVSGVLLTRATFAATASLRLELPTLGQGLNDLAKSGASFVEWRANLAPADVPRGAAHVEAEALARGAAAAQAVGLLPLLTIAMPDLD